MSEKRERRDVVVKVGEGEKRQAKWEQGVGIWVPGHDINVADRVDIEGTPYVVQTMTRLVKESEPWTIIKKAEEADHSS